MLMRASGTSRDGSKFGPDFLHAADADTDDLRSPMNSVTGLKLVADAGDGLHGESWTAQTFAGSSGSCQSSTDTIHDHGSLELGEDGEHPEHRSARRCRGVEALLVQRATARRSS